MADWYAIYRTATGELVSLGTVVADSLPAGLTKKQVRERPHLNTWDSATLDWQPPTPTPPDVDRVDEFITRLPRALRGQDETRIRTALTTLLGDLRFRDPDDTYEVRER